MLIYCAGGNRRFAGIAVSAGFVYGARLPSTTYYPVWFADQEWKSPDRAAYMRALAHHRPKLATVLDWEREGQLSDVLDWAEEASQYAERVIVIPKVIGGVRRIPRRIGDADVVLGYSVPTRFSGSDVPLWEMSGWPIHLLGGSPQRQIQCWLHLSGIAEVVSVDGNMMQKLALQHNQFWSVLPVEGANVRHWPTLAEADGERWGSDAPYEAFRRSCQNIRAAWGRLTTIEPPIAD